MRERGLARRGGKLAEHAQVASLRGWAPRTWGAGPGPIDDARRLRGGVDLRSALGSAGSVRTAGDAAAIHAAKFGADLRLRVVQRPLEFRGELLQASQQRLGVGRRYRRHRRPQISGLLLERLELLEMAGSDQPAHRLGDVDQRQVWRQSLGASHAA